MPNLFNPGDVPSSRTRPGNGVIFGLALLAHLGFTAYLLFLQHPLWEALAGSTAGVLVAAYVTRLVLTGTLPPASTARALVARSLLSWANSDAAEQVPGRLQRRRNQQPSSVQGEVIE